MQKIVAELLGRKIREERVKRGWTQKDLADRLYVDASDVSRMENGKNIGNLEKLVLVANSLNIDLLELIAAGVKTLY
ncbi:MAG: helix-turn-helix transcriptional regulator [Clostridia bacterium]|nr:helix-turn-helix transcriptional regulator [Clostridia bacterium]